MKGTIRIAAISIAALAASLLAAPAASASTAIGQTGPLFNCSSSAYTYVQVATGPAPTYTAPATGVITSWSTDATGNAGQTMALKVLRQDPSNAAKYFTLAEDISRPLATLTLNVFPNASSPAPVRIPIEAGDVLGAKGTADASCTFNTASNADQTAFTGAATPVDPSTSVTYGAPLGMSRIDLAAAIEPDADGDKFGDETQDLCPTSAATQSACPPPPATTDTGQRASALKKCKKKRGKKARKKCRRKAAKLPV